MFKRINLEISNICNLKCSFCPEVERPQKVMSVEDFSKVLKKISPHTEEIVPHLLGEPLNHPKLVEILDTAKTFKVPINLTTNGVLLTDGKIPQLLHPALRQINFSLQSFGDNFKNKSPRIYLERIKRFSDMAFLERPDLYINLRFWDVQMAGSQAHQANHSVVQDASLLKGDCDEVFSPPSMELTEFQKDLSEIFAFDWSDVRIDLRRKKNWLVRNRLYLHFDSRFEWPQLDKAEISTKGFCHGLTGHIGIHADGTVVPCCLDDKAVLALGNIYQESLEDILQSKRATNIREGFAKGELREALCQRCDYVKRFSKKATKLKSQSADQRRESKPN